MSNVVFYLQIQAIFSDETAVEQIQKRGPYRPRKPRMTLMSDVFGRGECDHSICLWLKKIVHRMVSTRWTTLW